MGQESNRKSIYSSRLFSRRALDLRARIEARHPSGEQIVIHGRTNDVSRGGAGLTLTRELPSGIEVALCLHIPGAPGPLLLEGVVTRRRGFRVGLQFVRTTAEQRLLLCQLCYA